MALVLKDRVKETTTTTGTGTVTLGGAAPGFQSFAVIGNTNTTYYTIAGQTTSEWEVGIGTYTSSGTTLARTTVLSNSAGTQPSALSFSAGTKDVFVTYPSSKSVNLDASGNATALGTPASGVVTNLTGTASININGTVGATTAAAGAFTTLSATGTTTLSGNQIISVTDNTNAALRITQLGTGNALLVEDSANPDATPFVVTASGYVGIGTTSPGNYTGGLVVFGQVIETIADDANGGLQGSRSSADVGSSNWYFNKSRGTTASKVIVNSGDGLGILNWRGYDGASNIVGATISAAVDGTPGTNDMPGRLVFSTTADGASSPTERMRIDSSGNVGIGTTSPSTYGKFAVNGTSAAGTVVSAIINTSGTANSQAVLSFDPGANGFNTRDSQIRATNNGSNQTSLEFYTSNAATPAEAMRITFAGNVGIGNSSPTTKLDVTGIVKATNVNMGYTSTATAAGTTTLTASSTHYQRFTGTTTQTIVLPVTSTLATGVTYAIENASTGNLTVNSSGGNLVVTVIPGVTVQCMCIGTTLTTAADWDPEYNEFASITGSGAVVLATSPTLVSPVLGTPTSGTLTNCTFPTLNQNTTGSAATFTSTSQNSQFNSVGVGTAASATAGEIRATNNITAYYSDDRFKTNLGNIPDALAKVQTLNGFYYEANELAQSYGYEKKLEVGVSAQQVQAVQPEVVAPAPIDENYLTVRYERLVPLLIEAIKELNAKVTALEQVVAKSTQG